MGRAFIPVDPYPRVEDLIFTEKSRARLNAVAELHCFCGEDRTPDDEVEEHLPRADIIGQTHLDAAHIDRAAYRFSERRGAETAHVFGEDGNALSNC